MNEIKPNQTYSVNEYSFNHYANINIKDVCDALGIKVYRGGKIICPCHDDHNPSAVINTRGRHKNKWHCFVCNEGGDNISLVMAVKYGISPTEYFSCPERYKKEFFEAIEFLEDHFPGGDLSKIRKKHDDQGIEIPKIPIDIYNKLGLDAALFFDDKIDKMSACDILLDRFDEYEMSLKNFGNTIFNVFPSLTQNRDNIKIVKNDIHTELENLKPYKKLVSDYLEQLEKIAGLDKWEPEFVEIEE